VSLSFGRRRVGVAALVVVLAAACGSSGSSGSSPVDPTVRNEFLRRLRRSTVSTWWVTSRFHRVTPAGPLDAILEALNRPPDRLNAGFGTVRGTFKGFSFVCSNAAGGKLCGTGGASGPGTGQATDDQNASPAQALASLEAATAPGGPLAVRADGAVRIAGRRARCYSLLPRRPNDATERQQYCVTGDGVTVRSRIRRPDSTDLAIATRVRTAVSDADFERLLHGYPIGKTG
jgi:hypothetical protein